MTDHLNDAVKSWQAKAEGNRVKLTFIPAKGAFIAGIRNIVQQRLWNEHKLITMTQFIDTATPELVVYVSHEDPARICGMRVVTDGLNSLMFDLNESIMNSPYQSVPDILKEFLKKEQDRGTLPPTSTESIDRLFTAGDDNQWSEEPTIFDSDANAPFDGMSPDESSVYSSPGDNVSPNSSSVFEQPRDSVSEVVAFTGKPAVSLRREVVQFLKMQSTLSKGTIPNLSEDDRQNAARSVVNALFETYPAVVPGHEIFSDPLRNAVNASLKPHYPDDEVRNHVATQLSGHLFGIMRNKHISY